MKIMLAVVLSLLALPARAQDVGQAQGSVSSSMSAFVSSNSASLEGALAATAAGERRLYLGLPTMYWPESTQHFKWGLGVSWISTEQGWGKPQAATAFSVELVETGRRIFAKSNVVAAPWTHRWQVWGSAGTAFPRESWGRGTSWRMSELLFLGVNVSARVL